ncbi:hypothetical protein QIA01_04595 (plasmid) [Borreliella americana]|nr:hypothetical protein [Borreliella americana]WKD01241.1 hypothetical protein QIA01_04595 [Borreliella americana]
MRKINVLLTLLTLFSFSCMQNFGDVKALTEIDSRNSIFLVTGDVVVKDQIPKEISLIPEEAQKLETLKIFLKDAIAVNGRDEKLKIEYEKSYKEFFDWLSKDVERQKEFVSFFDNIFSILSKAVDLSKKQRPDPRSIGLDFKDYVCYKIKNSTGGYLSLFFQKVADAFGGDAYKKDNDEHSEKPVKCNEEIFKVIKTAFTESENNNELKNLKNCESNSERI